MSYFFEDEFTRQGGSGNELVVDECGLSVPNDDGYSFNSQHNSEAPPARIRKRPRRTSAPSKKRRHREEVCIDQTNAVNRNEAGIFVLNDPNVWRNGPASFHDAEKVLAYNTAVIPESKVGGIRPSGSIVFHAPSACYVIDLSALRSPNDVRSDSLGAYHKFSTMTRYYANAEIRRNGPIGLQRADKKPNKPNKAPPSWDLMIVCRYDTCKSSGGNLQRKIYEAYDRNGVKQRMAIVSYEWAKGVEPYKFEILPHGNKKKSMQPYQKTPASTFEAGRVELARMSVCDAVEAVSESLGGIMGTSRAADLPTRIQFESLDYRMGGVGRTKTSNRGRRPRPVDEETAISALITDPQSIESIAVARDHSKNPNSMKKGRAMRVFCMSEDMTADFQRICVGKGDTKRPISVDSSFDMGTFFLTLLSTRDPVFLIPKYNTERVVIIAALFHGSREISDFKYLGEQFTDFSGCRDDVEISGWISDGDPALVNGLKQGSFLFDDAPNVRCERHMEQNVRKKLKELGVAGKESEDQRFFIEEIFGQEHEDLLVKGARIRMGGLVDLSKANLRVVFPMKKAAWDMRERQITGKAPTFFDWFQRCKVLEIEDSYLPKLRAQITNNILPGRITTNDNEIINLMAQQNLRFMQRPLEEAVELLQHFVNSLIRVRQSALFSLDDETACVAPEFLALKRSKLDFDKMGPDEKSAHLQKVFPLSALLDSAVSNGNTMSISSVESNMKFFSQ